MKKMNFLHYKISGNEGDVVKVTLDACAYVRLLDPLNFEHYKAGRPLKKELGGWFDTSEPVFYLPYKGTFHLVIDLGGEEGAVTATVDIIRG